MKKEKNQNRFLWQARQRRGLTQKKVAYLLGQKFTDAVSRHESGQIPTLKTALTLEIIHQVPVRLLFFELYMRCKWEIRDRMEKFQGAEPTDFVSSKSLIALLEEEDYCTYAQLLKTPGLPPVEKQRIHNHISSLAITLNKTEDK